MKTSERQGEQDESQCGDTAEDLPLCAFVGENSLCCLKEGKRGLISLHSSVRDNTLHKTGEEWGTYNQSVYTYNRKSVGKHSRPGKWVAVTERTVTCHWDQWAWSSKDRGRPTWSFFVCTQVGVLHVPPDLVGSHSPLPDKCSTRHRQQAEPTFYSPLKASTEHICPVQVVEIDYSCQPKGIFFFFAKLLRSISVCHASIQNKVWTICEKINTVGSACSILVLTRVKGPKCFPYASTLFHQSPENF